MIVTKTRTLGPQGNALQAEQQVGGNPVGATILIASDRHLEPEPERPIRLLVVASRRFVSATYGFQHQLRRRFKVAFES